MSDNGRDDPAPGSSGDPVRVTSTSSATTRNIIAPGARVGQVVQIAGDLHGVITMDGTGITIIPAATTEEPTTDR